MTRPEFIWCFDQNTRFYKHDDGTVSSGPIWRKHWTKKPVVGETRVSWLLQYGEKVPKRGADPTRFAFSEADIDRRAWVIEHRHRIARWIDTAQDHDVLQRVADVIGYKAKETK